MNKILLLLVLLLSLNTHIFAANTAHEFDTVVVFGDSLSDNGNLYRYLWGVIPASPPYFQGHFSNGPLWIEQLYDGYYPYGYLQGFQDYAVGGAGAVLSYKENLPFTLTMELDDYLYWHKYGHLETTLFVIWIGANNYLNGPTNIEPLTDSVVDAIGQTVEYLISLGGDKFLLANLPDLGRVPQSADMHNEALLTELTSVHNRKLNDRINTLKEQFPNVTLAYFDAHDFFNQALDNPSLFGLTDTKNPCYMGSYSGWFKKLHIDNEQVLDALPQLSVTERQMILDNPSLMEAARVGYLNSLLPSSLISEPLNCDGYLFWDHVHPTTYTHGIIAKKVRKILDDAHLVAINPTDIRAIS